MSGPFPTIPTGDPGAIGGIARQLSHAAENLEHSHGTLSQASNVLAVDWTGQAAAAYRSASHGLAAVVAKGAEEFHDCADALRRYSDALATVQHDLRRLETDYNEAVNRENAANAAVSGDLQKMKYAVGKAAQIHYSDASDAQQQNANTAYGEADEYLHQAETKLEAFQAEQRDCMAVLYGYSPSQARRLAAGSAFNPSLEPVQAIGALGGFGTTSETRAGPFDVTVNALAGLDGTIDAGDPANGTSPIKALNAMYEEYAKEHPQHHSSSDFWLEFGVAVGTGLALGLLTAATGGTDLAVLGAGAAAGGDDVIGAFGIGDAGDEAAAYFGNEAYDAELAATDGDTAAAKRACEAAIERFDDDAVELQNGYLKPTLHALRQVLHLPDYFDDLVDTYIDNRSQLPQQIAYLRATISESHVGSYIRGARLLLKILTTISRR